MLQIQADQRSWLGPANRPGGGVQRMQQDSDGIHKYRFVTGVGGHAVVHVVLGNVAYAEGNKGDWVTFDEFTLKHGKKKELYLDWLKSSLAAANRRSPVLDAVQEVFSLRLEGFCLLEVGDVTISIMVGVMKLGKGVVMGRTINPGIIEPDLFVGLQVIVNNHPTGANNDHLPNLSRFQPTTLNGGKPLVREGK